MHSVTRDASGKFAVTISQARMPGNWIAVGDGGFSQSIRLYKPSPAIAADPAHTPIPTIVKERCQ